MHVHHAAGGADHDRGVLPEPVRLDADPLAAVDRHDLVGREAAQLAEVVHYFAGPQPELWPVAKTAG